MGESSDLVDCVSSIFREVFDINIDSNDEYKEDIKLLDGKDTPYLFVEIKGVNAGVKREYINQTDSHRERADLPPDFPSLLIINTHIKNSRNIEEKDKEINSEQVKHANINNILILRTIDLLNMIILFENSIVTSTKFIEMITNNKGWLKCTNSNYEIITGI